MLQPKKPLDLSSAQKILEQGDDQPGDGLNLSRAQSILKKKDGANSPGQPADTASPAADTSLESSTKYRLAGEKQKLPENANSQDFYDGKVKIVHINPATGKESKGPWEDYADITKVRAKELSDSFAAAVKPSEDDEQTIDDRVRQEADQSGVVNTLKQTGARFVNSLIKPANALMTMFGKTTLEDIDNNKGIIPLVDVTPFSDEIREVKKAALKSKESLTDEEILDRAKEMYRQKQRDNLFYDRANSFLDDLDQHDKKILEVNRHVAVDHLSQENQKRIKVADAMKVAYTAKASELHDLIGQINDYRDRGEEAPDEIMRRASQLSDEVDTLGQKSEENYAALVKSRDDLGTAEQELDLFKRENRDWANAGKTLAVGFGEMGTSLVDFFNYATNWGSPLGELKSEELSKETAGWSKELAKQREKLRKPVQSIESPEGFVNYTSDLLVNQLPILAATATGEGGLALIGMSSAGQKYADMKQDIAAGANYSPLQMALAPALYGSAEVVSELPMLSILRKGGRVIAAAAEQSGGELLKRSARETAKEWAKDYAVDMTKEISGEEFTQFVQNFNDKYLLGKDDVGLLDGTGQVFKDTFTLTSMLKVSPHVAGAVIKGFQSKSDLGKLDENGLRIIDLSNQLGAGGLSDTEKSVVQKQIDKLTSESSAIMKSTVEKIGGMAPELYDQVVSLNKKAAVLKSQANDIYLNSKLKNKSELLDGLQAEYKDVQNQRQAIIDGKVSVVETLPIAEQDKLKRQALEDLVTELNPDGKKNLKISNDIILDRANELYQDSKKNEAVATKNEPATPKTKVDETIPNGNSTSDEGVRPGVEPSPAQGQDQVVQPAAEPAASPQQAVADVSKNEYQANRDAGQYEKDGITYVRNEKMDTPTGKSGTVKFADGEDVPFAYSLIEAEALQPSHIAGRRNPNFFIQEAQPKNRTDKSSQQQSDKIGQNPKLAEVGENSLAYSGAPIVNDRGEIIQGNNRGEGLKKHYANNGKSYKEQLLAEAERFGFSKEQIESMRNPVLVRRVSVDDARAIQLGNYDVKDIETGGKRRIDPVATTRRIPSNEKAKIAGILFSDNSDVTLNAAIREKFSPLINALKPYINNTQIETLVNKSGDLKPDGLRDLESLVQHFLFDGGDISLPETFEGLNGHVREGLMKSLPKLLSVAPEKSLVPEIQQAVNIAAEFAATNLEDFDDWTNQLDMHNGGLAPMERYNPLELKLAEIFTKTKTQKGIKAIFDKYAELANGKESDMFEPATEPKDKPAAVKETFDVDYNEPEPRQPATTQTDDAGTAGENGPVGSGDRTDAGSDGAGFRQRRPAVKTSEEAISWVDQHIDDIVADYIANSPNHIDPDKTREYFSVIGYDGKNVPLFNPANTKIVDRVYDHMLENSENKTIAFLTGVGGSGKTRATQGLDLSQKGITFDSALNAFKSIDQVLSKAEEKDFSIQVVPVYNDAVTAFKNTIHRGLTEGRWLEIGYFVKAFLANNGKIKQIQEKYPGIQITPFDNSQNSTKPASAEEAKRWNYKLNDQQLEELIKTVYDERERLDDDQFAALSGGIPEVEARFTDRSDQVGRYVSGINERLRQSAATGDRSVSGPTAEVRVNDSSPKINLSENLGLDQLNQWLDQAGKDLDNFGKETLSMGIPVAIAKVAVKAMKVAAASAKSAADVISAGLNAIRETQWFKNLEAARRQEIENDFQKNFLDHIQDRNKLEDSFDIEQRTPFQSWADDVIQKTQDRFVKVRNLQKGIEKFTGKKAGEEADFDKAEIQLHGKASEDLEKFNGVVEQLAKKIGQAGLTSEQVSDYLMAKHAPERNQFIRENLNPENPAGSGMTDQKAAEVIASFNPDQIKQLESIAKDVESIVESTRQTYLKFGLESKESVDFLRNRYEHYVPLKGFAEADVEDDNFSAGGRRVSVTGKENKAAAGRTTKAGNVLSQVIAQHQNAIIRGRKNEVLQKLYNLSAENPNNAIWQLYSDAHPDTRKEVRNGKLTDVSVNMKGDDRYVGVKIDGQQHYIKFQNKEIGKALNGSLIPKANLFVKFLAPFNRFLSMSLTSFDPEFVPTNFVRDIQTAMFNMLSEQDVADNSVQGKSLVTKTVKNLPGCMRAVYQMETGKDDVAGKFGKYYSEFKEDGAKTGWFYSKDPRDIAKDVDNIINLQTAKTLSVAKSKEALKSCLGLVENVNTAVENAVRLSTYVTAREAGVTRSDAAVLAKELTVNFNKSGEWGQTANAIFLFFNASIQGSARMAKAMVQLKKTVRPDGTVKKSLNAAQKVAIGTVIFSGLLSMVNQAGADDDDDGESFYDKIPDYEKERNMIIMKPDGRSYFKIPLPYGYNIFNNLGTMIGEVAGGRRSMGDAAGFMTSATIGAFSPVNFGQSNSMDKRIVKTVTPTALKPVADIAINENFFGSSIHNENMPFGTPKPDSQLGRPMTPEAFKAISKFLNEVSGGSDYRSGFIDWNPDNMDYIFRFLIGGTGKFVNNAAATAGTAIDRAKGIDKEYEMNKVPFVRRFYGEPSDYQNQLKYLDNRKEVNQLFEEYKHADPEKRKDPIYDGIQQLEKKSRKVDRNIKKINDRRDAARKIKDEKLRVERMNKLEELQNEQVSEFNKLYNKFRKK